MHNSSLFTFRRLQWRIMLGMVILGSFHVCSAQDAHYWNFQFGSKSALLGGAVIGSVNDASAVFYNPAALGLMENLSFTVSANVIEFSVIRLEADGGRGVDLGTSNTGLRPSLVAGTISDDLFGTGGVLAYSGLTRQSGNIDIRGLVSGISSDLFPTIPFDELAAQTRFDGRYNDLWVGLTYSKSVSPRLSVGLTWFNALRSQNQRSSSTLQGINNTAGNGASVIDITGGDFWTVRMLGKLGVFYANDKLSAGLTVTTPGLHLLGRGTLEVDQSITSPDTSSLAVNSQSRLNAKYLSPLSIGAGIGYKLNGLILNFSAEWYNSVDAYDVITSEPWAAQIPRGSMRQSISRHSQSSIVNWGVGAQYRLKPSFTLYTSYFLDQSFRRDLEAPSDLAISPIDIDNVSIGADFIVYNSRVDLGIGYSWGRIVDEELSDLLRGVVSDIEVGYTYRSVRLLFGIEIGRERKNK